MLEGTLALRTPGGWRELEEGEVVAFPSGEAGAHQLVNRGERTARFLAASTSGDPAIVIYPDSGKLGAFDRRPDGGGLWSMFRLSEQVDYYDCERSPVG